MARRVLGCSLLGEDREVMSEVPKALLDVVLTVVNTGHQVRDDDQHDMIDTTIF